MEWPALAGRVYVGESADATGDVATYRGITRFFPRTTFFRAQRSLSFSSCVGGILGEEMPSFLILHRSHLAQIDLMILSKTGSVTPSVKNDIVVQSA